MARHRSKLTLEYSAESIADLDEVWEWNAIQYGADHADRYSAFLKAETRKLAASRNPGRPVPTREKYLYAVIKRRSGGHGHVVAFQIDSAVFQVLRYFHTSQDWRNELGSDLS